MEKNLSSNEKRHFMKTWVSRYYSTDQTRHADVFSSYQGYEVVMFENDEQVHHVQCWEHSRHYAEDCAENWTERIIK